MLHPFSVLEPEYAHLLASAKVTRPVPVKMGVARILRMLPSYLETSKATGIPAAWIGVADCREDDCDPTRGIGQGDRWDRVSVNVPRGCGPFSSKAEADRFYLHYDHVDDLKGSAYWTLTYGCWKWEAWNGFGPRNHGRISGYLWSCMDVYDPPSDGGHGQAGKYVADEQWSFAAVDEQPGAVPLYLELIRQRPELALARGVSPILAPPVIPAPVPQGLHAGEHDTEWLQTALNRLDGAELMVDGSYGRRTREAARAFQLLHGLVADGLAGPITLAKIETQLAALAPSA